MNVFIYPLPELDKIYFELDELYPPKIQYPPEADIYFLFLNQLKRNYNIVKKIDDADLAFIPIDYIRLIYFYANPHSDEFTTEFKKNKIEEFWNLYVVKHLHPIKIPHFILFNYVLFEVDFSGIPENIFILAYENKVTIRDINSLINNGTGNRIITIPYPLNENIIFKQKRLDKYYFEKQSDQKIIGTKQFDIGFFGSIDASRTESLYRSREFLLHFNKNNEFKYIKGEGTSADKFLLEIKYLFVLRGDTPTRLCFYQCFSYGVCPIIYESNYIEVYSNLILSDGIDLKNSILILPDIKENESAYDYNKKVSLILKQELFDTNNFLNRIENHKKIFESFNYFKEPLCDPIKNAMNLVKNREKP